MGTHPKIIERIARTYIDKYRTGGFDDATFYAEQVVGKDIYLHAELKRAVERILKETIDEKR